MFQILIDGAVSHLVKNIVCKKESIAILFSVCVGIKDGIQSILN